MKRLHIEICISLALAATAGCRKLKTNSEPKLAVGYGVVEIVPAPENRGLMRIYLNEAGAPQCMGFLLNLDGDKAEDGRPAERALLTAAHCVTRRGQAAAIDIVDRIWLEPGTAETRKDLRLKQTLTCFNRNYSADNEAASDLDLIIVAVGPNEFPGLPGYRLAAESSYPNVMLHGFIDADSLNGSPAFARSRADLSSNSRRRRNLWQIRDISGKELFQGNPYLTPGDSGGPWLGVHAEDSNANNGTNEVFAASINRAGADGKTEQADIGIDLNAETSQALLAAFREASSTDGAVTCSQEKLTRHGESRIVWPPSDEVGNGLQPESVTLETGQSFTPTVQDNNCSYAAAVIKGATYLLTSTHCPLTGPAKFPNQTQRLEYADGSRNDAFPFKRITAGVPAGKAVTVNSSVDDFLQENGDDFSVSMVACPQGGDQCLSWGHHQENYDAEFTSNRDGMKHNMATEPGNSGTVIFLYNNNDQVAACIHEADGGSTNACTDVMTAFNSKL